MYSPKDGSLNSRIEALYAHFADKGYDLSKAEKASPEDIAYRYACECFCEGWSLDNGEKAKYDEVVRCGIATVCIRYRLVMDVGSHTEEDYVKACKDAVDKVLDRYLYRRVYA